MNRRRPDRSRIRYSEIKKKPRINKVRPETDARLGPHMRIVEQQVERAKRQLERRVDYVSGALTVWQKVGVTGIKGQVLMVDGDPNLRNRVAQITQSAGYRCDLAPDAVEATSFLQLAKYQLLIVDIFISKGSGYGLMRRAIRRFPGIKVIMTVKNDEQGQRAIDMGAFSYVIRPPDIDQLRHCILAATRLRAYVCDVLYRRKPCNKSCIYHFLHPGDESEPRVEHAKAAADEFDKELQEHPESDARRTLAINRPTE